MIYHIKGCACAQAAKCPDTVQTPYPWPAGVHAWSGWPGAYCQKCGCWDPVEQCLADNCTCPCHPQMDLFGEDLPIG